MRNILQELHILLTPDQEQKNVFLDILVVGIFHSKSQKDHLIKANLPNVEITERSESFEKGNCQVRESLTQFYIIQSGILNCNSRKGVYFLKCRIFSEAFHVGNAKTKFKARFNNCKSGHTSYRKKLSQQRLYEHYGQHSQNEIDDC